MIRAFFKDSVFYIFATLLTRGIGFLLLPVYTRYLSVSEYGALDFLLVIGSLLAVILPLEISQGLHRFLPEHINEPQIITEYYSTSVLFTSSVYVLFAVLFSVFSAPLAQLILGKSDGYILIILASWIYVFNALLYLATSLLRSKLQPLKSTVLSVVSVGTTAAVSIFALVVLNLKLLGVLTAMLIGSMLSVLLSFFFTRQHFSIVFELEKLKNLLKFSLPLVPSSISVIATMYIDRLVIRDLLTLEELGLYGFASRIALIGSLVMVGFQQALSPLIYSRYQDDRTPNDIAKLFWLFVGASIIATLALHFGKDILVDILGNSDYREAGFLIAPLCLSVLFSSCYLFFPGLSLEKKTTFIAFITILGALLNFILNYMLINFLGLIGAAYSSVISTAFTALIYIVLSQRFYSIPIFRLFNSGD